VLSETEEATLSFRGAVAGARQTAWPVAVVDLGGASTEIAVGRPADGPGWIRSVDLGALRLTTRLLRSEQPAQSRIEAAQAAAAAVFDSIEPPRSFEALAVGGCARALRKIVGPSLGPEELAEARELLESMPHAELVRRHGVHLSRAPLLLAAVLILGEVQLRLGVPLQVVDGGLREGALLASHAAIAA
jgi:exopolyphosphatase/guanosine-5'-triphosphate,3'-diphosphate pyrophosphatase